MQTARNMAKKRKPREEEPLGANPLAVVQWGSAGVMSALILYNAFFGQGGSANRLAALPKGATLHMEVEGPSTSAKTITIRYDASIEEAQRQLLATGHYKGLVDGIEGNRTKIAVEAYQKANDMPITGEVTPELLEHIRYTRKITQASNQTGSITPVPDAISDGKIFRMQKQLLTLGYDTGEPNGKLNSKTREAIRSFETDHDIEASGAYSEALMKLIVQARSTAATDQ
jgi:peptidoglycan hydrolase-like protein with peptidoglycan-binding domain